MKLKRPDGTGLSAHLSSDKRARQDSAHLYFAAAPEQFSCNA